MSDENAREELRALVAEATPGPWAASSEDLTHPGAGMNVYSDLEGPVVADCCGYQGGASVADAAYIAAASPDRITALLDDLDAAERDRDQANMRADRLSALWSGAEAKVAAVRALQTGWNGGGNKHAYCIDPRDLRAALDTPADTPTEQKWPCAECGASDPACEDSDGGCCGACRATGGCSHGPVTPATTSTDSDADEREALANAWSEGEQAGRDNADDGYPDPMVTNPYRTQGGEDR